MDEQMQELEQEGEVRQGPEDGREAQAETPPGREAEEAGELFPLKYMDGIHRVSPVSYTHLDVYKRQEERAPPPLVPVTTM